MSWEKVKLKDITIELASGGRPKGGAVDSGIPSLGAEHLSDDGAFNFSKVKYIPQSYFDEMTKGIISSNDILIVKDGATTGKVSIVNGLFPFENAAINEHLFQLKVDSDKISQKFLFYFLYSNEGQKQILSDFRGATVGGISREILNKVSFPLPPLPIQQKIAAILDQADALRKKDQQLLAKYDELLQAVFYDMFGDPVKNEKGWEVKNLRSFVEKKGDLVDGPFGSSVNTKVDYVENGEIPVVRTKNVYDFEFIEDDLKYMTKEKYETVKRSQVLPGDIILTKVGTIGNVCLFPKHLKEGVLSTTGSCRIRPNEKIVNKHFLIYTLHLLRPYLLQIAAEGVQPFLNMTHIKGIPIINPSINLQNHFATIAQNTQLQKDLVKQDVQQSEALFQSLLQRAFKGELISSP